MTGSCELPAFRSVAFMGLGLIAGSLAKLIRHQLPETTIFALDKPEILSQAQADGVLSAPLSDLSDPQLQAVDLIILGTHAHQSYALLESLVTASKTPLNIMDLGSSKSTICQQAETLSQDVVFIGGHPLAGREISGYENSLWDLFLGKRFLLTPCAKTPPDFHARIIQWLSQLGTIPISLDPAQHDSLMGLVSHFPQFYAVVLANLLAQNQPESTLNFLGGGIDDQMRLMASPYEMWRDIFQDNKDNLNTVLTQFIEILQQMQQALTQDNLADWFAESHQIYKMYQDHKAN